MTKLFTTLILTSLVLTGCAFGASKINEEKKVQDQEVLNVGGENQEVKTGKKVVEEIIIEDQELKVIPAEPKEIDISSWKLYKNEEYGFEFEIPINFAVFDTFFDKNSIADDFVYANNDKSLRPEVSFYFDFLENPYASPSYPYNLLIDFIRKDDLDLYNLKYKYMWFVENLKKEQKKLTVNNIPALYTHLYFFYEDGVKNDSSHHLQLIHNNYLFTFKFQTRAKDTQPTTDQDIKATKAFFDKVVETLRFTD